MQQDARHLRGKKHVYLPPSFSILFSKDGHEKLVSWSSSLLSLRTQYSLSWTNHNLCNQLLTRRPFPLPPVCKHKMLPRAPLSINLSAYHEGQTGQQIRAFKILTVTAKVLSKRAALLEAVIDRGDFLARELTLGLNLL